MIWSIGGEAQAHWMDRLLKDMTKCTEAYDHKPPVHCKRSRGALAYLRGNWRPSLKYRYQLVHRGLGWWYENKFQMKSGQVLKNVLIEMSLTRTHQAWLDMNEHNNFRNLLTHGLELAQEAAELQEKLDAIICRMVWILHRNGAAMTELVCCMLLAQLACGPGLIWAGRQKDGVAKWCWASTEQILRTFSREDLEILLWSLAEIVEGAMMRSPVCASIVKVVLKGLEPCRLETDELTKVIPTINAQGPWSRMGLSFSLRPYRCKIYPNKSPVFEVMGAKMIVWRTGFDRLDLELSRAEQTEMQRHLEFRSTHFVDKHNLGWLIVESVFNDKINDNAVLSG